MHTHNLRWGEPGRDLTKAGRAWLAIRWAEVYPDIGLGYDALIDFWMMGASAEFIS